MKSTQNIKKRLINKMFDVGFWEMCLVGLVSLLVIGPEKLPKVARLAGFWLGKTRTVVASVKAEIKEELQAEEMRQILKEQAGIEEFQNLIDEGADAINDIDASVTSLAKESQKSSDDSK